jgi:hypothetical protein
MSYPKPEYSGRVRFRSRLISCPVTAHGMLGMKPFGTRGGSRSALRQYEVPRGLPTTRARPDGGPEGRSG